MSDYDSPWKEALDQFFPAFLAFFFPEVHALVDWSQGYESLDKELQQVVREAEVGKRLADKLFKVWLKDGQEVWVLVHIEVQSQREEAFAERMYIYHYRLYDRYRRPVISLAVLGDEDAGWWPDRFGYSVGGCEVGIRFPVVKLLDYGRDLAGLEANPNPFAAMVLAHLKTMETRRDAEARRLWKLRVIKGLYERGLDRQAITELLRLIDWMMDLPKDLEELFIDQAHPRRPPSSAATCYAALPSEFIQIATLRELPRRAVRQSTACRRPGNEQSRRTSLQVPRTRSGHKRIRTCHRPSGT